MPEIRGDDLSVTPEEERYLRRAFRRFALPYLLGMMLVAGAVFHVWLLVNYQLLATGTVNLANAIIERAEAPAQIGDATAEASYA